MSFPDELRGVLEECLSEEASSTTLDRYLPQVRSIVTNLLKGLRGKQTTFRQLVSNNRPKSDASGHSRSDSGQLSRSSRSHARRDTQTSVSSTDDAFSRRNTQSSVGSSRRKESGTYDPMSNGFVGGFAFPTPMPQPSQPPNNSDRPSRLPSNPRPTTNPALPLPSTPPPHYVALPEPDHDPEGTPVPQVRASAPQVPSSVKRYSLVDKPFQPPSVVVDESSPQSLTEPDRNTTHSPPPELPAVESLTADPGVAGSLAALKKSDLLERRASKRFSTYNISKMTGVPRGRSDPGSQSNRRSLVAGGGGTLTAKELSVLTEADEEIETPPPAIPPPRRQRSVSRTRGPPPPEIVEELPPVPPLPRAVPVPPQPPAPTPAESSSAASAPKPLPSAPSGAPESITVFLQVGREVKKAKMEPGLTFSSLRMLFVDKFAYNPGQEDFPAIYIRDPSSGVQYELEDADEVKDSCLLSLNIEREYSLWRS